MIYLLDTHMLIWWVSGTPISSRVKKVIDDQTSLVVSDVSCWEIAWLVKKKRLSLTLPLREWLEAATAAPLVQLQPVTAAIASLAVDLPPAVPKDPADRLIVASAIILGAQLVTADKRIIDAKVVKTLS